jgi:hypothetical protein
MEEKMKQINEEYLFQNKTFILKKENKKHLNISKKDKKFYKKRILNISKKILDDEPQNLNNDIIFAFNSFIKLLIKDFKMIDTNDIYQDDYKDFNFDNYKNEINDINEINEINEINDIQNNDKNEIKNLNYITKYKNNKNFNLDNFVLIINKEKNKINEEINTIILPKKRIADIKNPLLKNKGLLSKKNEKKEKE